jgi:SAM-dependent methyltransferase
VGGFWIAGALYVVTKLGVADCLDGGPLRSEDLALMTDTHAPSLYRVLRALASVGVFQEDEHGYFNLTTIGQLLRSGKPDLRRSFVLGELGGAAAHTWEEVLYSVTTGRPAQCMDRPVSPRRGGVGPHGDEMLGGGDAARLRAALLRGYDFSRVKTIVDIGGGDGTFLAFLLQAYEPLCGVVFDYPWAAEAAYRRLAAEGVARRCAVKIGEMLDAVPSGYDLYTLREVLCHYKDAHVVKILQNCRRAMAPRGKLLIVESVAAEGNRPSFAKLRDIKLMISSEGRERTEAELRALLRKAGLRLTRLAPTSLEKCILEVERETPDA